MPYQVRCHCGAVQAEVDAEFPAEAISCNCSHCTAKGLLLTAIGREQLTVQAGEDRLRTYQFNRRVIDHRFCADCGTQTFAEGKGPDGTAMAMVNLRCAPQADLTEIKAIPYDGASV
jgi:hypothetical protein